MLRSRGLDAAGLVDDLALRGVSSDSIPKEEQKPAEGSAEAGAQAGAPSAAAPSVSAETTTPAASSASETAPSAVQTATAEPQPEAIAPAPGAAVGQNTASGVPSAAVTKPQTATAGPKTETKKPTTGTPRRRVMLRRLLNPRPGLRRLGGRLRKLRLEQARMRPHLLRARQSKTLTRNLRRPAIFRHRGAEAAAGRESHPPRPQPKSPCRRSRSPVSRHQGKGVSMSQKAAETAMASVEAFELGDSAVTGRAHAGSGPRKFEPSG